MFGTRVRAPRPVLLILVYGAFLAVVGVAATAQSILVGAHFNSATLTGLVGSDAATVRSFVNAYVPPADLSPTHSLTGSEIARLEAQLATLPRPGEILRVEIRRPEGTIVAASEPGFAGADTPETAETMPRTSSPISSTPSSRRYGRPSGWPSWRVTPHSCTASPHLSRRRSSRTRSSGRTSPSADDCATSPRRRCASAMRACACRRWT